MTYYKDLTGKRFGFLTVIALTDKRDTTCRVWLVKCDCGKTKTVRSSRLISGDCTSCGSCSHRKIYGESSMNQMISAYKAGAQRRNLEYTLTDTEFQNLTHSTCYYCGQPPSNIRAKTSAYGEYVYNGIDRVDNSKGYTTTNVVPCCFTCNRAKDTMPKQEFYSWIKRVYNTLASRNRDTLAATFL